MEHVSPDHFPWLEEYIVMNDSFLGLPLLKLKACRTLFYVIFGYLHLWWASTHIPGPVALFFSMPMWFVCCWLSTCSFKLFGMMMYLPLSIMPSITASSSLYDQYGCKSACSSSLLSGQAVIIIPFSCCRWLLSEDAYCISATDTHSGISIEVCMASTWTSMPFIGWSFPSV